MINHTYKCIFIHQRKAAGSSIIDAFDMDMSSRDANRFNGGARGQDWNSRDKIESSYFVFSVVRNPFDRVISAWRYLKDLQRRPLEEVLRNLPDSGHDFRHITMTQAEMLREPHSGRLITDDLIRYERLQEDFDRISDRLGKPRTLLPVINEGRRDRDYSKYYTAETRSFVESIFREDMELFGYEF